MTAIAHHPSLPSPFPFLRHQALWIYRLRLLLAIRVQIAAHTRMLTDSASHATVANAPDAEPADAAAMGAIVDAELASGGSGGGGGGGSGGGGGGGDSPRTVGAASTASDPTDGNGAGGGGAAAVAEATPRRARPARQSMGTVQRQRNLETLSTKLLQTYAVTFGFTVNRGEGDAATQRESGDGGGGAAAATPNPELTAKEQLLLKMFNEVRVFAVTCGVSLLRCYLRRHTSGCDCSENHPRRHDATTRIWRCNV